MVNSVMDNHNAISLYNVQLKNALGTKGKIPGQKTNYPGQHRRFKADSRVSMNYHLIPGFQ